MKSFGESPLLYLLCYLSMCSVTGFSYRVFNYVKSWIKIRCWAFSLRSDTSKLFRHNWIMNTLLLCGNTQSMQTVTPRNNVGTLNIRFVVTRTCECRIHILLGTFCHHVELNRRNMAECESMAKSTKFVESANTRDLIPKKMFHII